MGTFDLNLKQNKFITSPRVDSIFGMEGTNDHYDFVQLIHPDDAALREKSPPGSHSFRQTCFLTPG
jgi:hypothetical protein